MGAENTAYVPVHHIQGYDEFLMALSGAMVCGETAAKEKIVRRINKAPFIKNHHGDHRFIPPIRI